MISSTHEHTAHIEVRYAETDQMGVVHHSVYAIWFEQARTEFFRTAGASYSEIEKLGFTSPVLELTAQFKNSTHYGEFVDVKTTLVREDRVRYRFYYEVYVGDTLCTKGSTQHCFLKNGKPTRELPESLNKLFPNET
ncbi:MAG: acyl-CoA thioesterase [Fibrobacter sp.]|nr:acyl-CoA thioesterase [Fibrobacter sp.]